MKLLVRSLLLGLVVIPVLATERPTPAPARLTLAGVRGVEPSPGREAWIPMFAAYTRATGPEMMSLKLVSLTGEDFMDRAERRFSSDHGWTWTAWEPVLKPEALDANTIRRFWPFPMPAVDETKGILVWVYNVAITPRGMAPKDVSWRLYYKLSRDGGRTWYHDGPIVHEGPEYSTTHPIPGVWIGKNGVNAIAPPLRISTGELLVTVQADPLAPDGKTYKPNGVHYYHDAAVLIGRWNKDLSRINWRLSDYVKADPARSTRGMIEPTVAEITDGRLLMTMRGSNDGNPQLPSYKWYSVSSDKGRTWSSPQPWKYSNGDNFFSGSSLSQLVRHTNGRVYWLGNISPTNAHGNDPRYPFVIGEVDQNSLMLIKDTVCVIADKKPEDPEDVQFSNFLAYEDRKTKEVVVNLHPLGIPSDANEYRVAVNPH